MTPIIEPTFLSSMDKSDRDNRYLTHEICCDLKNSLWTVVLLRGFFMKVAVTGKHQWILGGEHDIDSYPSIELYDGLKAQFAAGIKIVRLQETPDEIPGGGTPHIVSLLLHDKLVNSAKPGDRVEVRTYMKIM